MRRRLKEAQTLVKSLLEGDDEVNDLLDRADVRYIIVATGSANQKWYWQDAQPLRKGKMVYNKEDATQYRNKASADDMCLGLRNGAFKDATVEALIKRDIFAESDDVDRLTDQIANNGFVVVGTGEAGQKYYWAKPSDKALEINRARFSVYAKDALVYGDRVSANAALIHAERHYASYKPHVEVWLGESEDPKDFVDRANMQLGFTVQVGVVNPHRRRKLTWYFATHEGDLVKEQHVLSRARANYLVRRFKATYDPKRIKLERAYHPGDPNEAMFEDEADDFLQRLDSDSGYYAVVIGAEGDVTHYYTGTDKSGCWSITASEAKPLSKVDALRVQIKLKSTHGHINVYRVVPYDSLYENHEADDFLTRLDTDKSDYVVVFNPPNSRPSFLGRNSAWFSYLDDTVYCNHSEALRRSVEAATKYPTNVPDTKIMSRSDAYQLTVDNAWNAIRQQEGLNEAVYKRSTTQINAPDDIKDFLIQWGTLNIPDDKLYVEEDGGCGREDDVHVTVRYGVDMPAPSEEFRRLITTWKAFPIRLAGVTLFKNEKFDVVKLDVISEDLIRLNAEIRKQFPSQQPDKFPDYHPHMTIAYVLPGTCDQLEGTDPFKESMDVTAEFTAQRLSFKGAGDTESGQRVVEEISFDVTKSTEQRREEDSAEKAETEAEAVVAEALEDDPKDYIGDMPVRYVVRAVTTDGKSFWWHGRPRRQGVYPDGRFYPDRADALEYESKQMAEKAAIQGRSVYGDVRVEPVLKANESEEADDFLSRMVTHKLSAPSPKGHTHLVTTVSPQALPDTNEYVLIKDGKFWSTDGWQTDSHKAKRFKGDEVQARRHRIARHSGWNPADLVIKLYHPMREDDATDFVDRIAPEQFVIGLKADPPSYRQIDPSIGGYGRWTRLEDATPLSKADADTEMAALRTHPSMRGFEMFLQPSAKLRMQESADPFKVDFPADATEVLTKVRSRRNKRRAPVWF